MKTLCIDLRWIDSSGVGVYIQGIMPGIVENLGDIRVVGIGERGRIEQFDWSGAENFSTLSCSADRYSIAEQLQLPLVIPSSTDLFFSPYYTIPLLYRGRLTVTVHDMSHLVVDEIVKNFRKRIYAKTMFKAIRNRAELIFTVSDFSRREYLRLTSGKEQQIVVTHNGVSDDWKLAADLPPVRRDRYFVCVGNVKPYKNVRRLVEAYRQIASEIKQNLVIIGQSEGLITGESEDFFRMIRESGDRIQLTGPVAKEELLSLVAHSDGLVMPSLYEGFGLPPLEAMTCGVPVLASHAASLPEVCGDAALYFDPLNVADMGAKLKQFASDDLLISDLRKRGIERSKEFSWRKCAESTAAALREHLHG